MAVKVNGAGIGGEKELVVKNAIVRHYESDINIAKNSFVGISANNRIVGTKQTRNGITKTDATIDGGGDLFVLDRYATIKAFADEGLTVYAEKDGERVDGVWTVIQKPNPDNAGTGSFTAGEVVPQYITEEQYYKISPIYDFGVWEVTATDGTYTITEEVNVDEVTQFSVDLIRQIVNYTLLYDNGNEHTDITGGFGAYNIIPSFAGGGTKVVPTLQKNPTSMFMQCYTTNRYGNQGSIFMENIIDKTQYSAVTVIGKAHTDYFGRIDMLIAQTKTDRYSYAYWNCIVDGFEGMFDFKGATTIDFHNVFTSNIYIAFYISAYQEPQSSTTIKESNMTMKCMFLTKQDDISGLSDYGNTIEDILTNSAQLLEDERAVRYIARNCTGDFMAYALGNSTFMSALSSSPYKNILDMNEHWSKFLELVRDDS